MVSAGAEWPARPREARTSSSSASRAGSPSASWPRRAGSGAPWAGARGCGGCRAGSPCRTCGRPRRAPGSRWLAEAACTFCLEQVEHATGASRRRSLGFSPQPLRPAPRMETPPKMSDDLHAGELREHADLGGDLGGQLAGGGEHQGAGPPSGALAAAAAQSVEEWQREGGRLAGAGLCEAQHVGAFERGGDGLGLDGPGYGEPCSAYPAHEVRVKLEPVEAGCRDRLGSRHQSVVSPARRVSRTLRVHDSDPHNSCGQERDVAARPGGRSCCSPLPDKRCPARWVGCSRFTAPAPVRSPCSLAAAGLPAGSRLRIDGSRWRAWDRGNLIASTQLEQELTVKPARRNDGTGHRVA